MTTDRQRPSAGTPSPADDFVAGPVRYVLAAGDDDGGDGGSDPAAAQGFTTTPLQAMPSAFEAATDLASASPSGVAPLVPQSNPTRCRIGSGQRNISLAMCHRSPATFARRCHCRRSVALRYRLSPTIGSKCT